MRSYLKVFIRIGFMLEKIYHLTSRAKWNKIERERVLKPFSDPWYDFKDQKYIDAAVKATKWLLDHQMKNGGIPSLYVKDKFIEFERVDILAQTLRLSVIFLNNKLLDKKYEKNVERLSERLLQFQYLKEGSQKGGFFYGYDVDHKTLKEKKSNHLNSWVTMFALQSLIMYKQYLEGRLKVNLRLFI